MENDKRQNAVGAISEYTGKITSQDPEKEIIHDPRQEGYFGASGTLFFEVPRSGM